MTYPFLQRQDDGVFVKLNKELYPQPLIELAIKEEPEEIQCFKSHKDYYLVKLKDVTSEGCLAFLNYLIYLKRK
ncbi:MAG: hypothetical protein NC923_05090 [Candidatus Omnitrophica bacterium]|nr:hypothetical protein [Candidatus Omnitrophota bacterium]